MGGTEHRVARRIPDREECLWELMGFPIGKPHHGLKIRVYFLSTAVTAKQTSSGSRPRIKNFP